MRLLFDEWPYWPRVALQTVLFSNKLNRAVLATIHNLTVRLPAKRKIKRWIKSLRMGLGSSRTQMQGLLHNHTRKDTWTWGRNGEKKIQWYRFVAGGGVFRR